MMQNVSNFSSGSKPHFAGKTHRVLVVDDELMNLSHGIGATKEAAKSVGIGDDQIKLKLITTSVDEGRAGVMNALLKRLFPAKTGDGNTASASTADKDKIVIYTARDAHQALGILKRAQDKNKPIDIQILDNQMPQIRDKSKYLVSSPGESPFVIKDITIPALATDAVYSTAQSGLWSLSQHRNVGLTKSPKTFIFSGTIDAQVRQDALNYGVAACIDKPTKKADLQKAITDYLRAAQAALPAVTHAAPSAEGAIREERKSSVSDTDKPTTPPTRHTDSSTKDADTSTDDQAQLTDSMARLELKEKAQKSKVQDDPE